MVFFSLEFSYIFDILDNFRHPDILNEETKLPLELDIFLPQLNIAFEYNGYFFSSVCPYWVGKQHYTIAGTGFFTGRPLAYVQHLDQLKQDACKKMGITLISVPFWWNFSIESLKAAIYRYRPELFSSPPVAEPFAEYTQNVIDELNKSRKNPTKHAVEQRIALANQWNDSLDPTGW